MTDQHQDQRAPLRSLLAYAEREAARRAKGVHPGMMRLDDAELGALLDLLRREVGTAPAREPTGTPELLPSPTARCSAAPDEAAR